VGRRGLRHAVHYVSVVEGVDRLTVGDLSDPSAVQQAIDEFDRIGRDAFLEKYSFGPSASYVVVQNGREYPSKAIVGAAHAYQFDAPLRNADFSGGLGSTVPKLRSLGFEIRNRSEPDKPDRDYVRSLTVLALVELGRPAHRDEVIATALELGDFSEAPPMGSTRRARCNLENRATEVLELPGAQR
jgi:hypothetical protein